MGSQHDHAVDEPDEKKLPGEIVKEEQKEERGEKQHDDPTEKREPIFSGLEEIDPGKELMKKFPGGRNVQFLVSDISIGRRVQNSVKKCQRMSVRRITPNPFGFVRLSVRKNWGKERSHKSVE